MSIIAKQLTPWRDSRAEFEVSAFGETRKIEMRRGRDDDEADTSAFGCRVGWSGKKVWRIGCRFYRQNDGSFRLGSIMSKINGKMTTVVCWIDKAQQSSISKR